MMKLRPNRIQERSGVNATQALFESVGWVFQSVEEGNDYGKDAYIDVGNGENVTGLCATLQIKSGKTFRRKSGYVIPIGRHDKIWRESSLPVFGIVHDERDGSLYWCNITATLWKNKAGELTTIIVPSNNQLTAVTIESILRPEIEQTVSQMGVSRSLFDLCSANQDLQIAAMFDCFNHARVDARSLILVRRLLTSFSGSAAKVAINVLAHQTSHPDIFWQSHNCLPEKARKSVAETFIWSDLEISHMLREVDWQYWQRGDYGEDVYMLLLKDPTLKQKLTRVAFDALHRGDDDVAWTAMYLSVYFGGDDGKEVYEKFALEDSRFRELPLSIELEFALDEQGWVCLFE